MTEPHVDSFSHRPSRQFGLGAVAAILVAGLLIGAFVPRLFRGPGAVSGQAEPGETAKRPNLPPGIVEIDEAGQRNTNLQVSAAASQTLPIVIVATGVVAPEDKNVAHIRALARGRVEEVHVGLGSRVKAGQPLVTFDNIELGELIGTYLSEKAMLAQTLADLDVKQKSLARADELIKLEAIAQQTLDLRRAEVQNAHAAVTSQRARLAKVEEQIHRFGLSDQNIAALTPEEGKTGHRTASDNILRAPFDGIVTKFEVAKGEAVQPDQELFTLTNLTRVWVQADVYEKDLGRVQRDSECVVNVDTYPDRSFKGRLTYVGDTIDTKTRTAKLRCVIDNADNALKLDMFARVNIPTNERREAVAVPAAAVQHVDNQPVVFVRQSATRFERRDVKLGATGGGLVEILDGVKPGETVVGDGSFYLKTALLRERIGES